MLYKQLSYAVPSRQLSSVIPWNRFFRRAEDSVTRCHSWKLVKESCRCDCRLHFFSRRVINRWNSMSQEDIDAATVNSFKSRLEKRRKRQMDFFKDWCVQVPWLREIVETGDVWWSGWLYQVQPQPVCIPGTVTATATVTIIDGLVKLLAFNAHIFASKYPVSFWN